MIDAILITLLPLTLSAPAAAPRPPLERADEVSDAIRAAGKDVDALLALASRLAAEQNEEGARAAWERVLKLAPDNEPAHVGLRHHLSDGQWYESYAALSAHRRGEAREMLAKGLARHGEEWVPVADVPFLRMGWERAAGGEWLRPGEKEERARAAELAAQGYEQQDLEWVAPADFDKWRGGLWKVGDEWLSKDEANARHAEIGAFWRVPSEHFVALSTCDRDTAGWVGWYADQTFEDLARLFGRAPERKLEVVALHSVEQYNRFAAGDPAIGHPATETTGASSVHYAYFAEAWFDTGVSPALHRGVGVCYWNRSDPALDPYGQHAVRHAAAQSFIEGIDPSWDMLSKLVTRQGAGAFQSAAFWGEKRIPLWLRYGGASYCERFFRDRHAAEGADPWWARTWALENLRSAGGLPELDELFAFALDPTDPEGSARLLHAAGCVVSFILDGECRPVSEKHQAFKAALKSGESLAEAIEELEQAIERNQRKLEKYAGL